MPTQVQAGWLLALGWSRGPLNTHPHHPPFLASRNAQYKYLLASVRLGLCGVFYMWSILDGLQSCYSPQSLFIFVIFLTSRRLYF